MSATATTTAPPTDPPLVPSPSVGRAGLRPTRWTAAGLALLAICVIVFHLPPPLVVGLTAVGLGVVAVDLVVALPGATPFPAQPGSHHRPHGGVSLSGRRGHQPGSRRTDPTAACRRELVAEPAEASGATLDGVIVGRNRGIHRLPPAVSRVSRTAWTGLV